MQSEGDGTVHDRQVESAKAEDKHRILRPDSASRSSVRIRSTSPLLGPQQVEPSSPQPSVDRLSVTFAIAEGNGEDVPQEGSHVSRKSSRVVKTTVLTNVKSVPEMRQISVHDTTEEGDEDDYSASACAIMQRRTSTRRQSRRKRRPSSPFGPDVENTVRRRSSVYTVSSGDTAISVEDGGTQEQIFEKLKLHKEVLSGVKQQPWPIRRKVKLVRQAKAYVRRHEGALQERLAQNRSTKDVIARVSLLIAKKWQYFRRELSNLRTWLVPWELRIKEIESHFGSAVASYFTFLRWLFWINLVTAAILTAFVAVPEVLIADQKLAGERKIMLNEEKIKSKHLSTLWEFEGILKYSPFFYGWYTNHDSGRGYRLPLAYFVTNLVVYTYSFVAILRKMAENSRMSKLTEKEDECAFSWKLFTGWDFMIGNTETAHNRTASIVVGFKEALLEEAEKQKDERNWRIICTRIFVNVSVISLLTLSAYAVIKVVERSTEIREGEGDWWRQNEVTIVVSVISFIFPVFFEILGLLENYHPRKQLRVQLARITVLNLLNLYSLIFALFNRINDMEIELGKLKPPNRSCKHKLVECDSDFVRSRPIATLASLSLVLLSNVSYTMESNGISETALPTTTTKYGVLNYTLASENDTYVDNFDALLQEYINNGDYPEPDYDYYGHINISDDNPTAAVRFNYYYNSTQNIYTQQWPGYNDTYEESSFLSSTEDTLNASTRDLITTWNETSADVNVDETTSVFESTSVSENESAFTSTFVRTEYDSEVNTLITDAFDTESIDDATSVTDFTELTVSTDQRVVPLTESNYVVKCYERVCSSLSTEDSRPSAMLLKRFNSTTRKKLRRLCWETMFGQELAKLTVMDLVLTILATLGIDFFRAVFVRFMNNCWCWDLEKQFPQYGDFKIAENILHLVNNQGMVWMGLFFSPGLTALNVLKLGILMYLRSWAVLTCNVPHEVVFRASRSNNFYFALLLTMLFLCVLPVGYAIVWVEPSWHCGPFSGYPRIYNLATDSLKQSLPPVIQKCLDYIASPGIVIPLIVLMTLIIFYMVSLTGSLREANNDLKIQLRHERTEERRKLFKIAEKRQQSVDTPFGRWKKLLPALPSNKLAQATANTKDEEQTAVIIENTPDNGTRKRFNSTNSEAAEMTDVEPDSLPHDPILLEVNRDNGREVKEKPITGKTAKHKPLTALGESYESQSSECCNIPQIRINETDGRLESHSNFTEIKDTDIHDGDAIIPN